MDIKRVTSALLGFPLVVIVLTLGNKYIVDIFLALVAMLGMQEYFNAVSKESKPVRWIGYLSCLAIGAVVIALIYTFAINSILNLSYSYVLVIIATAILSVVGQVGDFAASSIKRYADIKDYSNLIPGHGGMLDRIDSLMFLAPFAYLVFNLL